MLRRTLVAILAAAAFSLPCFAGMKQVVLETDVARLPPGTKVKVSMHARYTVLSMAMAKGAEPEEAYSGESSNVFEWSFTVPANGTVPKGTFTFHFERDLEVAPTGYFATVFLPTKYTIECPKGGQGCKSRASAPEFGMPVRVVGDHPMKACLMIWGGTPGFVAVRERCEDPTKDKSLHAFPAAQ